MTYDSHYRKCHYKNCDVPIYRPTDAFVATYAKAKSGNPRRVYYHLSCFILRWRMASAIGGIFTGQVYNEHN